MPGASPGLSPEYGRSPSLCTFPEHRCPGLGSGLPFLTTCEGQASLNSPGFSTTVSRGSCDSHSHPLCRLSYRGAGFKSYSKNSLFWQYLNEEFTNKNLRRKLTGKAQD
ncbi:MAG: hypothetical protein ACPLZD_08640 [Candidatus Saccharicenans sp.]|nr:hypothetical protein [Candidatus Aminicenantes bacterium]